MLNWEFSANKNVSNTIIKLKLKLLSYHLSLQSVPNQLTNQQVNMNIYYTIATLTCVALGLLMPTYLVAEESFFKEKESEKKGSVEDATFFTISLSFLFRSQPKVSQHPPSENLCLIPKSLQAILILYPKELFI